MDRPGRTLSDGRTSGRRPTTTRVHPVLGRCAVVSGKWRRVAERCAGMLGQTAAVRKIRIAVHRGHMRIQPSIASTSAFLSNTVVVVLDRIRLGKMGTSSRFLSVFAIFLRSRAT